MNRPTIVNVNPIHGMLKFTALVALLVPPLWAVCAEGQQASPAAPRLFELQVVGPDGEPVPDITVEIRGGLAGTVQPIKRGKLLTPSLAKTDGDGVLVIEVAKDPQRFVLSVKQPGYGPYWAEWRSRDQAPAIPERFVAELDAGWAVGGIVVDEDGNPVEGATVSPSLKFKKRPGDFSELYTGDDIKVDADGKWSFLCVPATMREVHVTINHADFMPARQMLTRSEFGIESGAEPTRKIELKRGVMLVGTVKDDSGSPIKGATVRTKFLNELREATTDDDGTYFLAGCEPRMTRIVAAAKGRALELQQVRVEPGMAPVDFVMKPGGKIRVRVLDENEKPIPRTRIFFQKWRGPIDYFEFDHVNEYTDANGVWEWNEAPLDEFKADICRPNGMQLEEQPLVAREEEYVFRPPTMLVISGNVIDAKTKRPISKFRVVPGWRWEYSRLHWSEDEAHEAANGRYETKRNRGLVHLVRIQADGYQSAVSRDIKFDEGNVTVDFELQPAKNIAPTIVTPDGAPAAGARIVVGIAGSQINIENGDIDNGSTYAAKYLADDAGRVSIPPQEGQFQIVITHPAGFAYIKSAETPIPDTIKLTPWAKVEGLFRVGAETVPRVRLHINIHGMDSYGDDVPHIYTQHDTTTDANGSFVFERVLPGEGRIGREIIYMVDEGATEVASSKMMPLELAPGETKR
ncbi:MAG TPA: carboxypeptidase-like regulatory domain-containing protein, partial [Lacipirellulaceae bacterium]|nr:carboxypeptidase-like regulatory domain-containing protein [Lacipirellulaceae bacterium]